MAKISGTLINQRFTELLIQVQNLHQVEAKKLLPLAINCCCNVFRNKRVRNISMVGK
jgi:hypothetical protein